MKSLMLVLLGAIISLSQQTIARECRYDRMRFSFQSERYGYFIFGSLDKRIYIFAGKGSKTEQLAERSKQFPWEFYSLTIKDCTVSGTLTDANIIKIEQSLPRNYSCSKCLDFDGASVPFAFPDRPDWNNFYDKGLRFTPTEIDQVFVAKAKLLERMRNNTLLANGISFYFNLFKVLNNLGVTELNEDGLIYLLATFRKMITPADYNRLLRVYKKIRKLTLTREQKTLTLEIESKDGQPVVFTGGDIPALDSSTRAMIDKYFKHIVIQNKAKIVIEDQKISTNAIANKGLNSNDLSTIATSSISKVSGLEITGNFPVIGEVKASIKKVEIDLDAAVPAKVGIGFKKFVEVPYTFNLDY